MKQILVTGGAGFIGSNLCRSLLSEGHRVVCLDNLSSGDYRNIENLLAMERFSFINQDVILPFVSDVCVDEIYHLACPASPKSYQQDPIQTFKTSVIGSLNMLELAKLNNSKILLSSTSEVYGDPLVHPQMESYWGNVNPIGLRSCYDEGKRGAECLFMDYHRMYNVKTKIARIFNTYGPNMSEDDGRVIPNFIRQSLNNEAITIYGDGLQTRSFQYVDDCIRGLKCLMDSNDQIYFPINLGNPEEITILELAQIIIKKVNSSSTILFQSLPEDDPSKRTPDINLANKLLKWKPRTLLSEGIDLTLKFK